MPTTADDIRAASRLRSVFGRLRPGFYDHEARRFEGPRAGRRGPATMEPISPTSERANETEMFRFSEDGLRLLSVALLDENSR